MECADDRRGQNPTPIPIARTQKATSPTGWSRPHFPHRSVSGRFGLEPGCVLCLCLCDDCQTDGQQAQCFVSDKRVSYLIGMQPSYLSCSGHWALQLHWFSICIANFFFCHCLFNIDPGLIFLERVFLPRNFTKNFPVGRQKNAPFFHLGSSVEECGKVMLSLGLEKSHATDTNCVTRLSVSHY